MSRWFDNVSDKFRSLLGRGEGSGPDPVAVFLKRHRKLIAELGLETGDDAFFLRETKAYAHRGVATELEGFADEPYEERPLAKPEMRRSEVARQWLTVVRDELRVAAKAEISRAESAIAALIDLALDPMTQRWAKLDEAAARKAYLALPPQLDAVDATTTARNHLKSLRGIIGKARGAVLIGRLKQGNLGKIDGRMIYRRFPEVIPFLSASLELELGIETTLSDRQLEQLVDAPEESFATALDAMLAKPRKELRAKLEEQLAELARQIENLPHIELLADADIATTVAPYYGGLSKSLKRRRAKSALVAVEERAREAKYQDDVSKLNEKRAAYADVASYYPVARSLKRKLVLYVGPTNSGKTWRALNDLAEADSGAYLAPLRLLALEGQEELEKRGKPASFLTGEERDLRPEARFVSSTIEMLNYEQPMAAVVIDEVQLLADERRGWAWLAAVVGAPAERIIMTGSPDCVGIVKDLAAYLGEELTVVECTRHNELRIAEAPIRLRDIKPGMAIVCFSRRDVQRIKNTIQENSDLKVAVVYGNLSPQVRREEARRFRSGEAEILVATDAIAMGLNLPISEVVFYTTEKFNGEEVLPLSPSDIRQIGGRAGRYGFAQFGVVNALDEVSLDRIQEALAETPPALEPPFYVAPGPNHVRIIGEVLQTTSLERILTFFERAIEFSDERFARSNIDDLSFLSTYVDEKLPFLDVTERLTIAAAPVGIRNETVVRWFLERMLSAFPEPDAKRGAQIDDLGDLFEAAERFRKETARSQLELRDAEDYLKTLTVYAWLAYRYPTVFTRIEECEARREEVNAFVERTLRTTMKEKPRGRGKDDRGGRGKRRRR